MKRFVEAEIREAKGFKFQRWRDSLLDKKKFVNEPLVVGADVIAMNPIQIQNIFKISNFILIAFQQQQR